MKYNNRMYDMMRRYKVKSFTQLLAYMKRFQDKTVAILYEDIEYDAEPEYDIYLLLSNKMHCKLIDANIADGEDMEPYFHQLARIEIIDSTLRDLENDAIINVTPSITSEQKLAFKKQLKDKYEGNDNE